MRETLRLGDTGDKLTGAFTMPGGTADTGPPAAQAPTPELGAPTAEHGDVPACGGMVPALAVLEDGGNKQTSSAATVDMLLDAHVDRVLVDWAGLIEPAEEAPPPAVTTAVLVLVLEPAMALTGGFGCGL